jgi:Zn-dependent M28 family amino/carboxypeptidase
MLFLAALFIAACGTYDDSSSTLDVPLSADGIREHTQTLSSDQFLGRGPGQPGGDIAAEYIANHFRDYGLEPVAGSYFQSVPMVGYTADPTSVALSFDAEGGDLTVPYLDGFVLNAGDPEATDVSGSAELVFVGYGINAPEADWDDFGDVDVEGKFLLILVNDPPAPSDEPDLFGGPAMTYYGRWTYKWEEAARQGALGALIVHDTEPAGYPWSVVRGGRSGEQFALPPDPSGPAPAPMLGWVTRDVAEQVLALAGYGLDQLEVAARSRDFVALPTGVTATAQLWNVVRSVETKNVVGLLPGSERPDEVITLTSHYDHFGIGENIDGDSIYNGAYDNASGTALLLELARAFAFHAERPARSLLFISTAAEEQGLLGSQWYVQSPLFPLSQTVAEINVDGANLWGETEDVTVQGEERSGLGVFVRSRAQEMGLQIMPDAEPEKGYFFRSDHFPFAKAGVPSLYIEHGRTYRGRPADWGHQIQAEFVGRHYHAPSDEFSDSFVFDGAVQQGLLVFLTTMDIAMDDTWPGWHEGQEFKAARDAMMAGR